MKFFRDWLRIERPSGVALHAAQTIELDLPCDEAFALCARGIEDVLGGAIRSRDEQHGVIEATFGLIDSERMTCTLESLGERRTRAIVESRRGARPEPARASRYVRALAEFLQNAAP